MLNNMEQSSSCRKQCHAKVIQDISVFSLAFLLMQTLVNNSRMKVDKLRLVNYILQVKLSFMGLAQNGYLGVYDRA